jgi:hypothetical protein
MSDVAQTLELSRIAAEGLFGAERLELEAPYCVDRDLQSVTIESGTEAGRALSILFFTYVSALERHLSRPARKSLS